MSYCVRVSTSVLLAVVMMLILAGMSATPVDDPCRMAHERAEAIRVKMGYDRGERVVPFDPLMPVEACRIALRTPEAKVRRFLLEAERACKGDCRWLVD